jgi:cyclase
MHKKRIVAAIDIANGKAVKSIKFENPAIVGDPVELAQQYASQGADEIVFLDILAYHEGRETIFELMKQASNALNVPVVMAGGIRTAKDIEKALNYGASKVSIASAAVENPGLLSEAAAAFGKEKIVLAIDAKRVGDDYHVFIKGGREDTGLDAILWAKKNEANAGEIVLNSMDADGTKTGYDIEMTKAVREAVGVPVVASGGCGEVGHIIDVFKQTDCESALVASLLHYGIATVAEIKTELEKNGL